MSVPSLQAVLPALLAFVRVDSFVANAYFYVFSFSFVGYKRPQKTVSVNFAFEFPCTLAQSFERLSEHAYPLNTWQSSMV